MKTNFELRQWQRGDEISLAKHANSIKIWNNVRDYFPHPYTIKHAFEWVNLVENDPNNFAIIVDGEAVGGIALVIQHDIYRKNAEIGYWLSEDYWGRSIMTNAVKQVVDYGFEHLGIHRIYAGIFEYNKPSAQVLLKAGFRHEATLTEAVFKNGQFWDDLVYSILRE